MHPLSLTEAALDVFPNVFLFDGGRYVVASLLFAAIGLVVMRTPWRVLKIQARSASWADYRRELLASLRSVLVYAVMFTPVLWAISHGYGPRRMYGASVAIVALYTVLMLIGHDSWFYWTHRLLHSRRFYGWHRTHHRSITPTPFAAYAFDARESFVQALYFAIWQMVIPTPNAAFFAALGISILRNAWGHLGIELHPRGFADHWFWGHFTTTTHHDLHHSGGFGSNYGLYFTWWDRICGTEHPRYREIFREVTARGLMDKSGDDVPVAA
jgi:sterol desaturase/sphingolipid hydroxylase (fatty acid hydroxylase superfamily)